MKRGLMLAFVASIGLCDSQKAQAFGPSDALNIVGDVISIVTNGISLFESYKKIDKTTKALSDKFNKKYDPANTSYDEFVINQALAYVQLVVEVAKPVAAMIEIIYKVFKIMQPIDTIFKEATQASKATYGSINGIFKGAKTISGNLEELLKKMQGKQYNPLREAQGGSIHINFSF